VWVFQITCCWVDGVWRQVVHLRHALHAHVVAFTREPPDTRFANKQFLSDITLVRYARVLDYAVVLRTSCRTDPDLASPGFVIATNLDKLNVRSLEFTL